MRNLSLIFLIYIDGGCTPASHPPQISKMQCMEGKFGNMTRECEKRPLVSVLCIMIHLLRESNFPATLHTCFKELCFGLFLCIFHFVIM